MIATIELEGLPATDRLDMLREHMLKSSVPLELRPYGAGRLNVRSTLTDVGGIRVLSVDGSGAAVHRTERLARADEDRRIILTALERGSTTFVQSGRAAHLRPGTLVAVRSDREYVSTFEAVTVRHGFQLSQQLLGLSDRVVDDQVARPIGPGHPLAQFVFTYLLGLAHSAPTLTSTQLPAVERVTVDLLRALFTRDRRDPAGRAALAETLGIRIEHYLRAHLGDRELSAARIAHAHGISERYLYVILGRSGISLGDWVRQNRLAAAALDLRRSSFVTVSAVAHRWGFADHAHFTRSFRQVYGMTPTDWRDARDPG